MKSSDEVVIRPAGPADLEPIVELTWAVAAEGRWIGTEVPFDRCARREALAGTLAGPASTLFAADAGPAGGPSLVGCISIRVPPTASPTSG